jgi:flagellum-specific ATP synthase
MAKDLPHDASAAGQDLRQPDGTRLDGLRQAARLLAPAAARKYVRPAGRISALQPSLIKATGLSVFSQIGDQVSIGTSGSAAAGEIVAIGRDEVAVKLYANTVDARLATAVYLDGQHRIAPSARWKGRVIDAFACPLDAKGPLPSGADLLAVDGAPPDALARNRLDQPFNSGVTAIDVFTPLCMGQRIGLFAGSGVGKSTLLAMLTQAPAFDTLVIALVGERGREVREFVEDCLGPNLPNAVVVVATSNESALARRRAPFTAMTIAEHFRNAGHNVLFIMDSLTRLAHACREVAIAAGEPPISRGYPPSTFAMIAQLLERAGPGRSGEGTITGLFSVLLDGENTDEPVADTVRGILDGHIVLSRKIAQEGRYPAIDLLQSISRLAAKTWSPQQQALVSKLVQMIERYEDTRDIRMIGGYKPGTDPELDECLAVVPRLMSALSQSATDTGLTDAFDRVTRAIAE